MRALLVGLMHGMAGSAALILLTLGSVPSVKTGLLYMLLFGLGSIAGPSTASIAMEAAGPAGFFWLLALTIGGYAIFVLYRLLIRPSAPRKAAQT